MSTQQTGTGSARVQRRPLIHRLGPGDLEGQLRSDVARGLRAPLKSVPSKWFYDYTGSMLFDTITRLPEYYLTRAERQILRERAATVVSATRAEVLVELGCGVSEKTRVLLDAFGRSGELREFVPFDVDAAVLEKAADQLTACYPHLQVQGIVGDFERHLDSIDLPGRCLVIFLGSTIGNLDPGQRERLLQDLASSLKSADSFLLGIDLVKQVEVIEAAYNDSAGLSAAFNLNMLSVLNSRLEADFDPGAFHHVARFNAAAEQMEMYLRSAKEQQVRLEVLDLEVAFAEGEMLHTEISAKFRREGIEAELAAAGLTPEGWWTDSGNQFALSLSVKP